MSELKQIQKDWLAALRSGDYKQGCNFLKTRKDEKECYCCLGVATDMIDPNSKSLKLKDGWGLEVSKNRNLELGIAKNYD